MSVYTRETEKMERLQAALTAYATAAKLENPDDTETVIWHFLRDVISTYSDAPALFNDAFRDWKQLG